MAIEGIEGIIFDLDDTLNYSFKHPELEGTPLPGIVDLLAELKEPYMIAGATNQAAMLYGWFQPEIIRLKNTFSETWKPKDYPTVQQVAEKLTRTWRLLGIADTAYLHVSVYDEQVYKLLIPSLQQEIAAAEIPDAAYRPSNDITRQQVLKAAEEIAGELGDLLIANGIACQIHSTPEYRKPEPGMLLRTMEQWGMKPHQIAYVGDMHVWPRNSDFVAAAKAGMQFVKAEDIFSLR